MISIALAVLIGIGDSYRYYITPHLDTPVAGCNWARIRIDGHPSAEFRAASPRGLDRVITVVLAAEGGDWIGIMPDSSPVRVRVKTNPPSMLVGDRVIKLIKVPYQHRVKEITSK